jgi:3-hydroxymyristoyl/3-hydroxydecanoyl-(acyl carrier protein) dehydratase
MASAVSTLKLPMEIEDIKAVLPHRYPFLLIDRVLALEPDRRCLALKNVASDERYFIAGPGGRPTLPASILTEAMAQTGAMASTGCATGARWWRATRSCSRRRSSACGRRWGPCAASRGWTVTSCSRAR